MTTRILLVDDVEEVRTSIARMLSRRYDVVAAASAREAIAKFENDGPFAVVVADYAMPVVDGLEFLREVHAHSPETVGVLMTGVTDFDIAVSAVHENGIYRFLSKPCSYEAMVRAIDEALEHHVELEAENVSVERLLFVKESLETMTGALEERIDLQTSALRRMHTFTTELCAASGLQSIVEIAAAAATDVLGGRGVHVQVWDKHASGPAVEASAGREMSTTMHREPLETRDGRIGEIVVDYAGFGVRRLTEGELSLVASIASSTAVAAHHEMRRRERDHAQHATVLALARLAEQRDNETGCHLERVAAYARLVAEGLRRDGHYPDLITDEWILNLERSSALHDIGKVGIPDSILLKPGKLTPAEWEIMKTHAELGAQTLDAVIAQFGVQGFLAMGRDIAASHHEKWDGSGYPKGLRGAAIPLSARILALADVYDALTTVRPYKHAWPHEEALDWIKSRANIHFDPEVVASFVRRADEANAIRKRLQDQFESADADGPLARPA